VTAFDYTFLGLLLLSVLVGFARGLISEVFSLLGWIVSIVLAWKGAGLLAPSFTGFVPKTQWLAWPLAFLAVFVVMLVILALSRWILSRLLDASGLSPVDRILGACFGAVRALFIALLLVAAGGMSKLPKEPWWRDAVLAPPLETAVIALKPHLPKELGQRIKY
jgi:membrane protein required for colicin V production